jgi:DNA-binding GntR family transcriptional regulator
MKASKKYHPTASIGTPRRKPVTTNAVKKTDRSPRRRKTRVAADKPESGPRLGELAYRGVLEGLFDRRVPAGSFFSQSELARLLNLPIQPLRDALRVLETEGILTIHARSGIEFLKADLELARSTYQYRSIIERAAARAYAESADSAEIAALIDDHRSLLERVEREGATDAVNIDMEKLEQRFHGSMIAALQNPLIEVTARRLKNYVSLIRLNRRSTAPRVIRTIREHLEVLEGCAARNPEAAEAALTYHFQAALQRILGMG